LLQLINSNGGKKAIPLHLPGDIMLFFRIPQLCNNAEK